MGADMCLVGRCVARVGRCAALAASPVLRVSAEYPLWVVTGRSDPYRKPLRNCGRGSQRCQALAMGPYPIPKPVDFGIAACYASPSVNDWRASDENETSGNLCA